MAKSKKIKIKRRSKMSYNKKQKPYAQQYSRRQRRRDVMVLKRKIEKKKEEYGGKFLSDVLVNTIDKLENKRGSRHFIDIFFVSKKDPSVLWNAEIFTAAEILNDHYHWKKTNPEVELYNICEEFKVHKNFKYGTGLTIIVNEKDLTQEVIDKIIENFYAIGEISWKSDAPVSKESLISIYENIYKKRSNREPLLELEL